MAASGSTRVVLYRVRMRHDGGVAAFRITASGPESAADRMCALEGAPPSAVIDVTELRVIHESEPSAAPADLGAALNDRMAALADEVARRGR